ncbi:hypothetical protein G7Z17_g5874 [Cylindrodendrum hubeiense]|uniref:Uncharacterized protein n=1 Tax=Cylindrodendrum hubeiense TaxID=595255 RepID=A0A9P5HB21_9HYPO|nr:hypothetical protein G7Z17_g5874 [Cylindrodendrum hubeiense]
MNIPTKEVDDADTPPRREPPHPDITRLRRELYSLKDQVRRSSVFLNLLCNTSPQPAIPGAPAVIQCLDGIVEAISTILTNHASDWIESDLDSRSKQFIPYHEFVALDPDVIHDVTGHLEELQDQLDVGEEQLVGTHTAEMIRNHQLVLLTECGQMAELASIADLLESLILHRA